MGQRWAPHMHLHITKFEEVCILLPYVCVHSFTLCTYRIRGNIGESIIWLNELSFDRVCGFSKILQQHHFESFDNAFTLLLVDQIFAILSRNRQSHTHTCAQTHTHTHTHTYTHTHIHTHTSHFLNAQCSLLSCIMWLLL